MTRIRFVAIVALGLTASACAITSASRQDSGAGEGVWYVKRPIVGNAKVFYCPPQSSDCYQADIVDPGKAK